MTTDQEPTGWGTSELWSLCPIFCCILFLIQIKKNPIQTKNHQTNKAPFFKEQVEESVQAAKMAYEQEREHKAKEATCQTAAEGLQLPCSAACKGPAGKGTGVNQHIPPRDSCGVKQALRRLLVHKQCITQLQHVLGLTTCSRHMSFPERCSPIILILWIHSHFIWWAAAAEWLRDGIALLSIKWHCKEMY